MIDILFNLDWDLISIFIILCLLTKIVLNTKKEWLGNIMYILWSIYLIYMLCFKNNDFY